MMTEVRTRRVTAAGVIRCLNLVVLLVILVAGAVVAATVVRRLNVIGRQLDLAREVVPSEETPLIIKVGANGDLTVSMVARGKIEDPFSFSQYQFLAAVDRLSQGVLSGLRPPNDEERDRQRVAPAENQSQSQPKSLTITGPENPLPPLVPLPPYLSR